MTPSAPGVAWRAKWKISSWSRPRMWEIAVLLTDLWVFSGRGEWGGGPEVEYGQGDEGLGGVEPERDSGEEADLGVGRLDEPVGQVVLDRGEDPGTVCDDALLQFHEVRDPAAPRPGRPRDFVR